MYADGARPIAGNRTWRISRWVMRERICAGSYRYWTPLGVLWVHGGGFNWSSGWGETELGTATRLADLDEIATQAVEKIVLEAVAAGDAPGLPPEL